MPALALNNPPRRDSQNAVISSTPSAKLIKVHSLISSTSSNLPNALKTVVIKTQKFKHEPPDFLSTFFPGVSDVIGSPRSAANQKPPPPALIVGFTPVLASVPITQLTCLLTRSPYLCGAGVGPPGCPLLPGTFAKRKRGNKLQSFKNRQGRC